MVDSRDKGARAELQARDLLRKSTGLKWERVPGSGALGAQHKLKGDLYVPEKENACVVEVKHYADDHLTSKVLTDKDPQLLEWWKQTLREGAQVGKHPVLVYKFDRSKWFVAFKALDFMPYYNISRYLEVNIDDFSIITTRLDYWLEAHRNDILWVV